MAIGDKTFPFARRVTQGTSHYKNLHDFTFGYTETRKKVAVASATAVHAATTLAAAGGSVTASFTNPDVPRVISVTTGGTTANIRAGIVEIHGTNVEGAVIHEELALTDNQNGATTGVKAFKTVTSYDYPPQDGASATLTVGYGAAIGVNHRLPANNVTVKVFESTTVGGEPTLQGVPTVVADESNVEQNTVVPATTPDGTTFLTIAYAYDDWATSRVNDAPTYWDATTTSTSTTTATTTTTSTSSTSSSTSSTSVSTSSTSSSTSSTSTSTTTVA